MQISPVLKHAHQRLDNTASPVHNLVKASVFALIFDAETPAYKALSGQNTDAQINFYHSAHTYVPEFARH
jgi:hypothetical protein